MMADKHSRTAELYRALYDDRPELANNHCRELLATLELVLAERDRLREVLRDYEQWEASVIGNDNQWRPLIAYLSDDQLNRLIELQQLRNAVLHPESTPAAGGTK